MRIGIIAEGGADIAVITNVLKGITGLDSSDFVAIQPRRSFDNTTLQHQEEDQKGGWTLVKKECEERKKMAQFFALEDSTHVVIHMDSAEAEQYGIKVEIEEYHAYCMEMRQQMVAKIKEWLNQEHTDKILFAIAIEEIDAWVLMLYNKHQNTCKVKNPKKRLEFELIKQREDFASNYKNYLRLTKPFSKKNALVKGKYLDLNCSLKIFHDEVVYSLEDFNNRAKAN